MRASPQRSRGLTLLELVVVLFILSTIALGALAITADADHQIRDETTRQRLDAVRTAIVGEDGPVFDGERRLSGFVADLGALPTSIADLVAPPANAVAFAALAPELDPNPSGADGTQDGDADGGAISLTASGEALGKGWRGPYLRLFPGTDLWRDGFGNVSPLDDAVNHGWVLDTSVADELGVGSLGADGLADADPSNTERLSAFDDDVATRVLADDWRPLAATAVGAVTVRNGTGAELADADRLRVSLLVHEQRATGPVWRRITSDADPAAAATLADGDSLTLAFPATARIPIGRHLLVLVDIGADDTPHTDDDDPFDATTSGARVVAPVAVFARADGGGVELVIR